MHGEQVEHDQRLGRDDVFLAVDGDGLRPVVGVFWDGDDGTVETERLQLVRISFDSYALRDDGGGQITMTARQRFNLGN